ncbi:MAG TPA: hypothetical protein VFW50_35895 [Streptosporangiaceae bacterium]|nr:hypothetical protein [Streptosporangiaceae bacterium]
MEPGRQRQAGPRAAGGQGQVIKPSARFGRDIHAAMLRGTGLPVSDYYERDGYVSRRRAAGAARRPARPRGRAGRGDRPVPRRALTLRVIQLAS